MASAAQHSGRANAPEQSQTARVATRLPPLAISSSLRTGVYKIGYGPDT
jgi:hypothetical protein